MSSSVSAVTTGFGTTVSMLAPTGWAVMVGEASWTLSAPGARRRSWSAERVSARRMGGGGRMDPGLVLEDPLAHDRFVRLERDARIHFDLAAQLGQEIVAEAGQRDTIEHLEDHDEFM